MKSFRNLPLAGLAAGALVISACADNPVEPAADLDASVENATASFSLDSSLPATTDNLFVVFRGNSIPAHFAADVAKLGGNVEIALDRLGAASVSGLDADGAAALARLNGVRHVEPELLLHVDPQGEPEVAGGAIDFSGDVTDSNPATAFFFARQWHLRAIQADDAWAAGRTGTSDVTVAILDTGIDYLHADLAGLVDLERSISMLPTDDLYVQAYFPGAHPIADLHYHGTHVAATVSSNALAAAGVTSNVTLMGVKVCSILGGCPSAAIFGGLVHAAENGADVINMSLGGNFRKRDFPGYVAVVIRALNEVNRHGALVVVSAGNSAIDMDRDQDAFKTYCDAPNAVCVSATGPTSSAGINGPWANIDALATYSNYGRSSVDVAAPGGNTGGSVHAACSTFSLIVPICQTGTYVIGISGTSMAAPHASGVAALIVEDVGPNRPGQVAQRLHQTADKIGHSGNDPRYGKGRINAYNAIGGGQPARGGGQDRGQVQARGRM